MTVTYSAKVATSSFACFLKLLFRWKGSIYKLLWKDFALFAFLYYALSFMYRFALTGRAKRIFENIALYCETYNNLIPVAFVLGFYVSLVVGRFWEQFQALPWPYNMALYVSSLLQGNDTRGRLMRRTIMRYFSLAYVITLASISPGVRKRFPTFQHMVDAGLMVSNELEVFEKMKTSYNTYFVPLVWSASLITRARKEGRIKDDFAVKTLIDEVNAFRGKCGGLFNYDWVTIPLVYTQVVTLAVYMFFLSCLMGRQFLDDTDSGSKYAGDLYFPLFTFLQFFFYMGWLKVAESLLNPFGEDDDDFDVNGLIDCNLEQTYLIVDGMHNEHPELIKDQYWDTFEIDLPYTHASVQHQKPDHIGSAVNIQVPASTAQFVPGSMLRISEEDKGEGEEVGEGGSRQEGGDEEQVSVNDGLLKDQQSSFTQNFARSFGSNQNVAKLGRRLSNRVVSKTGTAGGWGLLNRQLSHLMRRGRSTVEDDDVEAGEASIPQSPISLYPVNEDTMETKASTSFASAQHKEDLQFEMSDDEGSLIATPTRLSTLDETSRQSAPAAAVTANETSRHTALPAAVTADKMSTQSAPAAALTADKISRQTAPAAAVTPDRISRQAAPAAAVTPDRISRQPVPPLIVTSDDSLYLSLSTNNNKCVEDDHQSQSEERDAELCDHVHERLKEIREESS